MAQRKLQTILTGWSSLFLLINLVGVLAGYNLHTVGFMAILGIAIVGAIVHVLIFFKKTLLELWQSFFF